MKMLLVLLLYILGSRSNPVLHFISGGINAQIRTSSQLNCSFEDDCRWRNATGTPEVIGWTMTNDIIPDDRFPAAMSKNDEGNSFVYSNGPPGMHMIELVSDIVDCQLGGAKLSFWYYYGGAKATLDVCSRWPPGSLDPAHRQCFEPAANSARAQQWTFASVELPPSTRPMEIIIRARYEPPKDIVAIDDIKYEAILCESTHLLGSASGAGGDIGELTEAQSAVLLKQIPTQNGLKTLDMRGIGVDSAVQSYPKSPFRGVTDFDYDVVGPSGAKEPSVDVDLAELRRIPGTSNCGADCNFDDQTFCGWTTPPTNETVAEWDIRKDAMFNPVTGIKHDLSKRGFMLSTSALAQPHQTFALSRSLNLDSDAHLQFAYYLAGIRGRLRVCLDYPSLQNCPFDVTGVDLTEDSRKWKLGTAKLEPGKGTVTIVADHLSKNYIIGVDEVRLLDGQKSAPARCAQDGLRRARFRVK